ncbi:MAG: hypothetical protein EA382_10800 [Spirochaetaceae bacterium]|nr:MAG: hypothetical protein EA382_10800 [Spirochaetaceae bacterium]
MERIAFGRRLGAFVIDTAIVSVVIAGLLTAYAVIGGTRLAIEARQALGVDVSIVSLGDERVWQEYGLRAEEAAEELARLVAERFTDEQTEYIVRTMARSMERSFDPRRVTVDFLLAIDANVINRMVDEAFDSVIADGRADIDPVAVEELRTVTQAAIAEFAIASLTASAIRFALMLVLLPLLAGVGYALIEGVSGRSPGKLVMGCAVRSAAGPPTHAGAYLLRFVVKNAPVLLLLIGITTRGPWLFAAAGLSAVLVMIGSLVALSAERRTLHDYVAGTAVYRVSGGGDW